LLSSLAITSTFYECSPNKCIKGLTNKKENNRATDRVVGGSHNILKSYTYIANI